jgi:hypothetical protein
LCLKGFNKLTIVHESDELMNQIEGYLGSFSENGLKSSKTIEKGLTEFVFNGKIWRGSTPHKFSFFMMKKLALSGWKSEGSFRAKDPLQAPIQILFFSQ